MPKLDSAERLRAQLGKSIIIGDGAIGTRLYYLGYDFDTGYERLNLTHPQLIEGIHREYLEAGAEAIETNSFCANANKLKKYQMEKQVVEINHAAASIARAAVGDRAFVLGSIGPLRISGEELTPRSNQEGRDLFAEQAQGLYDGGVDAFILETFLDLVDLENAIAACRATASIPIIAQMSFFTGEGTPDGHSFKEMVQRIEAAGVDALGGNCISGPAIYLEVVERLRQESKLPLTCFPNAGYPQKFEGRFVYSTSPQYFGKLAVEMIGRGCKMVGGCCGTNPDHIREVAASVQAYRQGHAVATPAPLEMEPSIEMDIAEPEPVQPSLLQRMQDPEQPFVTVEVEPPRGLQLKGVLEGLELLRDTGIDALNISDNPLASVRMDSVVFAIQLRQRLQLPTIVHLTCRDRNLLGLQATLLGAQTMGIEAILALTGDPASIGDQPGAKSVYNTNSIGLVKLIQQLNDGKPPTGYKMKQKSGFEIGVALNPNSINISAEMKKLDKKISAGAQFIQTQPLFEPETVERFLDQTRHIEIPILLGLLPLVSHRSAEYIHNEIPGMTLGDSTLKRLQSLPAESASAEGLRIAKEVVDAAKGRVAGFYLITPQRKFSLVLEIVNYINKLNATQHSSK